VDGREWVAWIEGELSILRETAQLETAALR
jgi:hypothetical protein